MRLFKLKIGVHTWFAWYPVFLEDTNEYVWLTRVYRKPFGTFKDRFYDCYKNDPRKEN